MSTQGKYPYDGILSDCNSSPSHVKFLFSGLRVNAHTHHARYSSNALNVFYHTVPVHRSRCHVRLVPYAPRALGTVGPTHLPRTADRRTEEFSFANVGSLTSNLTLWPADGRILPDFRVSFEKARSALRPKRRPRSARTPKRRREQPPGYPTN